MQLAQRLKVIVTFFLRHCHCAASSDGATLVISFSVTILQDKNPKQIFFRALWWYCDTSSTGSGILLVRVAESKHSVGHYPWNERCVI